MRHLIWIPVLLGALACERNQSESGQASKTGATADASGATASLGLTGASGYDSGAFANRVTPANLRVDAYDSGARGRSYGASTETTTAHGATVTMDGGVAARLDRDGGAVR